MKQNNWKVKSKQEESPNLLIEEEDGMRKTNSRRSLLRIRRLNDIIMISLDTMWMIDGSEKGRRLRIMKKRPTSHNKVAFLDLNHSMMEVIKYII